MSDLVEDNVTGYLVNSGDSIALANKIVTLLEDPLLARRMGEEGRKRVVERYTVKKMVEAHEMLFEKLLQNKDTQRS
jgi:glycosyltransferase involved in cell wall biosynthesis